MAGKQAPNKGQRPAIESFLDYRRFLADYIAYLRRNDRTFSLRKLAEVIGVSHSLISLILSGKRNLDDKLTGKLAGALDLDTQEEHFLRLLIEYDQTSDIAKRQNLLAAMSRRRNFRERFSLDRDYLDYISKWYIGAVLALVEAENFEANPEWIAQRLQPSISTRQAQEALDLLVKLELIEQRRGKWKRTTQRVNAPDEGLSEQAVRHYHLQRLEVYRWALENLPPDRRNFTSITALLNREGFIKLREYLHRVRAQVAEYIDALDHTDADIVTHINWQLFPVSKHVDEDDTDDP